MVSGGFEADAEFVLVVGVDMIVIDVVRSLHAIENS